MRPHPLRSLSLFVISALSIAAVVLLRAADRPPVAPEPIESALVGAWVQVGEPGHVSPTPAPGAPLKFRVGSRWTYTQADPRSGLVTANFGGTYRVSGREYTETIDYSTDANDTELGRTLKFTVKVEGDLMTQTGVNNPYTEVWKRLR